MHKNASFLLGEKSYVGPQIRPNNLSTVGYVNRAVEGRVQPPARLISTQNIVGWYDKAAQQFTLSTAGVLRLDSYTVNSGERVVLAGQSNSTQNGIYIVVSPGDSFHPAVLERAATFNQSYQVVDGTIIWITHGAAYEETLWVVSAGDPFTLDGSVINFVPMSTESTASKSSVVKLSQSFFPAGTTDENDVAVENDSIDWIIEHNTGDQYPVVQFYSFALKGLVEFAVNFDFDFASFGLPQYSCNNAFVVSCSKIAPLDSFGEVLVTVLAKNKILQTEENGG